MGMRQSTKGILLSGLIYPGAGQFALDRFYAGTAFLVLTTIGLVVLIFRIAKRIYLVLDQLMPMLANDGFDFHRIVELSSQTSYPTWSVEILSLALVLCCWMISIFHAYLLGKKQDKSKDN
jgi:hypothetical protein